HTTMRTVAAIAIITDAAAHDPGRPIERGTEGEPPVGNGRQGVDGTIILEKAAAIREKTIFVTLGSDAIAPEEVRDMVAMGLLRKRRVDGPVLPSPHGQQCRGIVEILFRTRDSTVVKRKPIEHKVLNDPPLALEDLERKLFPAER